MTGPCLCGDPECGRCFPQDRDEKMAEALAHLPADLEPESVMADVQSMIKTINSAKGHYPTTVVTPDGTHRGDGSQPPSVIECSQCDQPATRFPKDYDEYCDACFAERFVQCAGCDAWALKDEIGSYESSPATRMEPAEYEECCRWCAPDEEGEPDDEPDEDYV